MLWTLTCDPPLQIDENKNNVEKVVKVSTLSWFQRTEVPINTQNSVTFLENKKKIHKTKEPKHVSYHRQKTGSSRQELGK